MVSTVVRCIEFEKNITILCPVLRVRPYFKLQTVGTIYNYAAIRTYGTLIGERREYRRENQYHKKCLTAALMGDLGNVRYFLFKYLFIAIALDSFDSYYFFLAG